MTPAASQHVWVLEALRGEHSQDRWVLDSLEDEVVHQHLGFVPEGLWDANESLLAHIRERYGIEVDSATFKQVIIGREQRGGCIAADGDVLGAPVLPSSVR